MKNLFNTFLLIVSFGVLLSGCTSTKIMNKAISNDTKEGPKIRLDLANQYYNDGDYYKAIQLYEIVINENIMIKDLEEVYYNYAGCHFAQFDFQTASTLYNSFYKAYPESPNADDAYYFRALSSYEQAEQDYRLDQSTMVQAMKELQDYLITFPEGVHAKEATDKINEIRLTNERKELATGKLYFQITEYKAAISEYNRFIEDNPTSELVEEAYFEMLKARYELAKNSIDSKKKERLQEVLTHHGYFMEKYSTGPFASEVNEIQQKTKKDLNQL